MKYCPLKTIYWTPQVRFQIQHRTSVHCIPSKYPILSSDISVRPSGLLFCRDCGWSYQAALLARALLVLFSS